MEESKQGINLNLTSENYISELNTADQNYNEADYTSGNTPHTLIKTVNYHVELNGSSNQYVQDANSSTDLAYAGMSQNSKNELMKYQTPQMLWRKRHEAKQGADFAANGSPSRYASYKSRLSPSPSASTAKEYRGSSEAKQRANLASKCSPSRYVSYKSRLSPSPSASTVKERRGSSEAKQRADLAAEDSPSRYVSYKSRLSPSPSSFTAKEHRGSSDGRAAWLMRTRTIRMQTPQRGPRSHLRSLTESIARTRKNGGMLRRPRRSLESGLVSSPGGWDPSEAQNGSNFEVRPKFESYQLVGDSLFVRFAEQMLDIPCGTVEGSRGIGLCVSGQKSGDLLRRLHERMYPVTEKIVLLIGTNDVLQNISEEEMCKTLRRLLIVLKMSVSSIVLLTLPPIPKLHKWPAHREKIHFYNNFIRSLQDEVVSVADIHSLYVTENQACKMEMFERYYGDGQRLDLIHLNRSGLQEIHKFLLQNNFVN